MNTPKTILEYCITDLRSAEAAIRIKRQLHSSSRVFVPRAVFLKVDQELRHAGRALFYQWFMTTFEVDGREASIVSKTNSTGYWWSK